MELAGRTEPEERQIDPEMQNECGSADRGDHPHNPSGGQNFSWVPHHITKLKELPSPLAYAVEEHPEVEEPEPTLATVASE